MATYRLIHREASTGERSSSLSHLGFRVWVQYQLSADDYGICPAEAAKLQGDNPVLLDESTRRVQAEIENLIGVRLVGAFLDGKRRYLYQPDWQDWQRIEHPTQTPLPCIPGELFGELSPKTQKLFAEKHPKRSQIFALHARARDAHANANASDLRDGVPEQPARPRRVQAPGALAGALPRDHVNHGWCGARFCVTSKQFGELARRYGAGGEAAVTTWLGELEAGLGPEESPGGPVWVLQHFDAWLVQQGRMKPAPRPAAAAPSAVPGVAETERLYLRRKAAES